MEAHQSSHGRTDADKDDDFLADVVVRDATRRLDRELSDEAEVSLIEAERFAAHGRKSDYINIRLLPNTSGNAHTLGYLTQKIVETGVVEIQRIDADEDVISVLPNEN